MRDKPLIHEEYRVTEGPVKSDESYGVVGAFIIPVESYPKLNRNKTLNQPGHYFQTICHDGSETGWEHVSMTILHSPTNTTYCPLWQQMATIKEVFWHPDEMVLQYHPKDQDYVNIHKDVLHLFRPIDEQVPSPPKDLL